MGRIKTRAIKRVSEELVSKHEFTDNFDDNKALVEQYMDIPSKKLRNIIVGYVTRLEKSKETL